ncbi:hypothetical protein SAMN04515674_10281 [Pseudarcicella hirudinis]|uniref:AB hydrolase-1 domain-containing protein n=1 Tax=Pseudarcicella hirudinis TaxID=1079859 RepID=A0A1I5NRF6_9BACT|nr:alpha/beta fold hydrolase [Pseudarcicella hirudinis]SFP24354.1 hypothetical protein SAMN04515674_10281 [Pseudarcicella hirudinis]
MPIIESSYQASHIWQNAHFSTIYPSVFRKVPGVHYVRERIELWDGDFLDLDWSYADFSLPASLNKTSKLVILTHGFLGNTSRPYILGSVKAFNKVGWDALAWNHRGLSGESNRLERLTTHGGSDDLEAVINHALSLHKYHEIVLVGFSKGGNISLKYAGEKNACIPKEIKSVVAVSVPADIQGSVNAMGKEGFYTNRFKRKLLKFLKNRPTLVSSELLNDFEKFRTLDDFTEHYVAPLHGMRDAREYYDQCSARHVVNDIKVPSLILNAQNDPVLSDSCALLDVAAQSDYIFSEVPKFGGHCGFYESNNDDLYWVDKRIVSFVEKEEEVVSRQIPD